MSLHKPKRFDGQVWYSRMIRQRAEAALAGRGLPAAGEALCREIKLQEARYRAERAAKKAEKRHRYQERMARQKLGK